MFCGHFLETAVHLAYSMSSVLEPKVWLKFVLFFFFQLGFFGWNFGSNCASSLPLLSFLSHTQ